MLKPGYKTTELYVASLTDIGAGAAALAGHLEPKWAAVVAAVSTAAYSIARGLAKLSPPPVVVPATQGQAVVPAPPVAQ